MQSYSSRCFTSIQNWMWTEEKKNVCRITNISRDLVLYCKISPFFLDQFGISLCFFLPIFAYINALKRQNAILCIEKLFIQEEKKKCRSPNRQTGENDMLKEEGKETAFSTNGNVNVNGISCTSHKQIDQNICRMVTTTLYDFDHARMTKMTMCKRDRKYEKIGGHSNESITWLRYDNGPANKNEYISVLFLCLLVWFVFISFSFFPLVRAKHHNRIYDSIDFYGCASKVFFLLLSPLWIQLCSVLAASFFFCCCCSCTARDSPNG